eukprot:2269934-Prorocentrum_lima.AAC.1
MAGGLGGAQPRQPGYRHHGNATSTPAGQDTPSNRPPNCTLLLWRSWPRTERPACAISSPAP